MILDDLGLDRVELLTANDDKVAALNARISVTTPLRVGANATNARYLAAKAVRFPRAHPRFAVEMSKTCKLRLDVVCALWNDEILAPLLRVVLAHLESAVSEVRVQRCPGAFEALHMSARCVRSVDCDGVLVLALLLEGETEHFRLIAESVTQQLGALAIERDAAPIVDGVLACRTKAQAIERCGEETGRSLAETLLMMATSP